MELLKRFAQGDAEAFEALFRQFQGEVYGWIVRIVRDRGIAEDLTVETFWRIHRAHARFDPEKSFGAWARRIATKAAIDHLKKARREVGLPDDLISNQHDSVRLDGRIVPRSTPSIAPIHPDLISQPGLNPTRLCAERCTV
jgi:RNA polymerase sigma-70 factor (ECF subfamily)